MYVESLEKLAQEMTETTGLTVYQGRPYMDRPDLVAPCVGIEFSGTDIMPSGRVGAGPRLTYVWKVVVYGQDEMSLAALLDAVTEWNKQHRVIDVDGTRMEVVIERCIRHEPVTMAPIEDYAVEIFINLR
jgi:hypothetical protein